MHRCSRRSIILTADQEHIMWYALMGEKDAPWRNQYTRTASDCEELEQMVRMGLLDFVFEFAGFRRYRVTEAGADAVGLWLP